MVNSQIDVKPRREYLKEMSPNLLEETLSDTWAKHAPEKIHFAAQRLRRRATKKNIAWALQLLPKS